MPNFTIKNGDTDEYSIFEWDAFSVTGKKIRALFDTLIGKDCRNWDLRRKVWFVHNSVADAFIAGMRTLFDKDKEFKHWQVVDQRKKLESFDDFFETPVPAGPVPKSKTELLTMFNNMGHNIAGLAMVTELSTLDEAKKSYRKLALAFHPDRNAGDGSRMSELNVIWAELQQKF